MSDPTHTPESTGVTLPATTSVGAASPDSALPYAQRHDGWTPAKQAEFLHALAETHSVAKAARAVGMSRQSAYGLRARLKGEPFDFAWGAALRCRFDALAEVAMDRAMNGVEVPHFYRGELVGTSRKYDERLTLAMLKMRERFGPPRMPDWHCGARYERDDFAALVKRVETGPATWAEQAAVEYEDAVRQLELEQEQLDREEEESWNSDD
ncbi:hypothetical protein [Altererythrobacter lutimaris]|uniref:LysR family transcriptional regulator n=1 Tax=Altererythrobacter lutimaris TaxID=2743979 RepID=A0A850HJ05_9SPHN|nr:hypothetical protein [Altererythrobacter lutimaris]NVE95932.1 hypothetical protein [Altererythrobacter lutimaris]